MGVQLFTGKMIEVENAMINVDKHTLRILRAC